MHRKVSTFHLAIIRASFFPPLSFVMSTQNIFVIEPLYYLFCQFQPEKSIMPLRNYAPPPSYTRQKRHTASVCDSEINPLAPISYSIPSCNFFDNTWTIKFTQLAPVTPPQILNGIHRISCELIHEPDTGGHILYHRQTVVERSKTHRNF